MVREMKMVVTILLWVLMKTMGWKRVTLMGAWRAGSLLQIKRGTRARKNRVQTNSLHLEVVGR
jgi:hypothetical protein